MPIQRVMSRAPYTKHWGYSRAVKIGDRIVVSGTSATQPDGSVHAPGDPYAQTKYVLELVAAALADAGASLDDVIQTRVYIASPDLWREVGRAHLEYFGQSLPASTCIAGVELMQPGLLVEIEAEAFASH